MITAAKLINHPVLTDAYGVSKVFEVARRLRELEIYPSGKTELSTLQAATLLYTLTAVRSVSQVYSIIEKLPTIRDRWGTPFINEFTKMLEDDRLVDLIKEISISQETGLVYIVLTDNQTVNLYCSKGSVEPRVKTFCTIEGSYLREFVSTIKLTNTILSN